MAVEPTSLARIAERSGFLMADVAFLAGLEGSTVSRLWDDPQWLDRVKGKSLQAIVSVLPGVGEYVLGFSLADRRSRLAEGLSGGGVQVDQGVFRCLVQQQCVPEQYLSNALETAITILNGDVGQAAAHLARFWGRDQDFALGLLFGNGDINGLLSDVSMLVTASIDMIEQLNARKSSFHAIVAQANLMHTSPGPLTTSLVRLPQSTSDATALSPSGVPLSAELWPQTIRNSPHATAVMLQTRHCCRS
jgi:hypothetical protein